MCLAVCVCVSHVVLLILVFRSVLRCVPVDGHHGRASLAQRLLSQTAYHSGSWCWVLSPPKDIPRACAGGADAAAGGGAAQLQQTTVHAGEAVGQLRQQVVARASWDPNERKTFFFKKNGNIKMTINLEVATNKLFLNQC